MKNIIYAFLSLMLVACQGQGQEQQKTQAEAVAPSEAGAEESYVEVYENGQVKIKGILVDGKRHGLWVAYYENGVRWAEENYEMGIKEGRNLNFYPNGLYRYRGQYSKDEKKGLWQYYDQEGRLVKEETY